LGKIIEAADLERRIAAIEQQQRELSAIRLLCRAVSRG
jgi:hypothetical protein